VRLVDDESRHVELLEQTQKGRRGEPLGSDVQELQGPSTGRVEGGTARLEGAAFDYRRTAPAPSVRRITQERSAPDTSRRGPIVNCRSHLRFA
jgi:hypothetical protein